METQNVRIRKYLESGKSLTKLEALYQFGCFSLSSRMSNLKKAGLKFDSKLVEITSEGITNRVSRYTIAK